MAARQTPPSLLHACVRALARTDFCALRFAGTFNASVSLLSFIQPNQATMAAAAQTPHAPLAELWLSISSRPGYRWVLTETVTIHREGLTIEIPKGFLSDGCDQCIRAFNLEDWLIRDWMYATHALSKTQTDSLIHGYNGHVCERHMQSDVAWASRPRTHLVDPSAADEALRALQRSRKVRQALSWGLLTVVAVGAAVYWKIGFNKEKARRHRLQVR